MLKRDHISSYEGLTAGGKWGYFPFGVSCRTHLSYQRPAVLENVDGGQHGKGAVGILRQTAIAHLGEAPQALEDQEGMLDLRRFVSLSASDRGALQWARLLVKSSAFGASFLRRSRCALPR